MKINIKEKTKYGGRIIAHRGNQEVGWLRYHIDFDDAKKITVSLLEVRYLYDRNEVEEVLLSYISEMYPSNIYTVEYDYKQKINT